MFKLLYSGLNPLFFTKHIFVLFSYHSNVYGWKCHRKKQNYYCNFASRLQVNPFYIETEDADKLEDLLVGTCIK